MNTYTTYQQTNIAWLGEIPSHWELTPIKALFNERNERNTGIKTDFILSVTKDRGVIPYDEKGLIGNNKSEDIEKYKLVYPNDLVINKMNVVIGSLGISKYFGAFSHVYLVYYPRNNNIYMKYFSHLFSIPSFYRSLIKYCTGIMELRESLNKDNFKNINLPLPPLTEQTAIAEFLDKKTAQIQIAIRLKREQIDRLKEYRQALINQTVTQGLNPSVPMKNSGIEWLGDVPEHWEVKKLKFVLQLSTEKTESQKSDLRYIGMENIISHTGVLTDTVLEADGIANVFYQDEILFGKLRPYLAKVYLAKENGICSTEFLVYKTSKQILNRFAFYMMICPSFIEMVNSSTYGTKMPRANSEFLANLSLAIPPLTEQTAIAEFLDKKTAQIDTALATYQAQIDKLNEYQRSLVNDVVTGKIDFRTI